MIRAHYCRIATNNDTNQDLQMKFFSKLITKLPFAQQRLGGQDLFALLRAKIEKKKKIFHTAILVPDVYEIILPPTEYKKLGLFNTALQQELQEFLTEYTFQKNYSFMHEPVVITIQKSDSISGAEPIVRAGFSGSPTGNEETEGGIQKESPVQFKVRLLVTTQEKGGELGEYGEGEYVLGRGKDADVRLDTTDQLISRRHCLLQINQREARIKDLASSNGTLVNGRKILSSVKLWQDDVIELGDTSIKVSW